MTFKNNNQIIFVISSLSAGGAEKVMAQLANMAISKVFVKLIVLSKKDHFYSIDSRVGIREPQFVIEDMPRFLFMWRNFWWLRKELKKSVGQSVLSFSGKYNAFVLLSSLGLDKKVFVSDRSRPGISYGKFLDFLNPWMYKKAAGIVAQTRDSKRFTSQQTKHKNIRVIPNPIAIPKRPEFTEKEAIVINVGRFIASKHQDQLIHYFEECNKKQWRLLFLGDGKYFEDVKVIAESSILIEQIEFLGNVKNVREWYEKAAVFAFTSTSEGFPNALCEAMAHGCACISYDCIAGPADIIDDGVNGFLIPEGDHQMYKKKLSLLMEDEALRFRFGKAAREKMKQFDAEKITQRFLDFMLEDGAT